MRDCDLTRVQLRVLVTLLWLTQKHQRPPTLREMAQQLGITTNSVYERIIILRRKGLVKATDGTMRTLRATVRLELLRRPRPASTTEVQS